MSRIRGRDTGPELILRKALWSAGFRYRIQYHITGKPDIVFIKYRIAIFVDGCFWHGCPLHSVTPRTNTDFWIHKIKRNMERDREIDERLKHEGWNVLRFWEHDIENNIHTCLERIQSVIPQKS